MLRLQELRKQMGLTQKELAQKLNMSAGNLCDWEKGRTEPDIKKLIELADFFDVSLDELLDRHHEETISQQDEQKYRLLLAYSKMNESAKIHFVEFIENITK